MRTDPLAGLSARQRRKRVAQDANYLVRQAAAATPEAQAIATATGFPLPPPGRLPQAGDVLVCARVDLDNPLLLADNVIARCADCDCDVQYRPDAPDITRLCLCCAARRMRETNV